MTPDEWLLLQFHNSLVCLNLLAAERFLRLDPACAPPSPSPSPSPPLVSPESPEAAADDGDDGGGGGEDVGKERAPLAGAAFELAEQSESPRQWPYCGETLPRSRQVDFCPQCAPPPSG